MLRLLCFSIVLLLMVPSLSIAEIKTIYASHEYVMGDNDSKNDARHMCFLEAKRKALEKAGTYISSHTVVKDMQLSKDEVNIYSAALLKVDTVKEEWKMVGANMAVKLMVKADVDTKTIEDQLSKIQGDTGAQGKIKEQQGRLNELERQVANLQKQLGSASAPEASTLRKERNVTFQKIDAIEAKKIAILELIKTSSKKALEYIERGMTMGEVRSLAGDPRSKYLSDDWNYGDVWIMFEGGVVGCVIESSCFGKYASCQIYNILDRDCIVK